MRQTIFTIIFVVLIVGIGYVWYNASPASTGPETETPPTGITSTRLAELQRLRTLQLDISILKDPIFNSLQSPIEVVGTPVTQVQSGRVNPFAPF